MTALIGPLMKAELKRHDSGNDGEENGGHSYGITAVMPSL